jgi:hypothetical protein
MLSRVCAIWLVMLIVLPFTAPFATCEVSAPSSGTGVRSLADRATSHALPVPRTTRTRVKLAVSMARAAVRLRLPLAAAQIHHAADTTGFVSTPLAPPLRI